MDAWNNTQWCMQRAFNRIGYKIYRLCLCFIRLNGGLPYSWQFPPSEQSPWWCRAARDSPNNSFTLTRRRSLAVWSYFIAMVTCATFMAYMILVLSPKLQPDASTAAIARVLKSLIDSVTAMGFVIALKLNGKVLARMVRALQALSPSFNVPLTMDKNVMHLATVAVIMMSIFYDVFLLINKLWFQEKLQDSILNNTFSVILLLVSMASFLPILLLFHCTAFIMAIKYNEVFESFHHHVSGHAAPKGASVVMELNDSPSNSKSQHQPNACSKENKGVVCDLLPATVEDSVMHKVDTSIHMVHNLQQYQRLFNEYFSVPVLLIMARSITSLIFTFFLVTMDPEENRSLSVILKIHKDAAFILLLCVAPETVTQQVLIG